MTRPLLLFLATFLPLAGGTAFALDEVIRRGDGSSVRGTIKAITKTDLSVEAAGRATKIPATDVAAVRWDGEPPQLNLTRAREENGDLDFALTSYRELRSQAPADARDLRVDLDFLIARTLAKQAIADPSQAADAVQALDTFLTSHGDFFRYFEALQWMGRVHAAAGDVERAKAAYARLAEAPLPELKMAAQNSLARIKLDQDDLAGALADFDAVLSQPADDPATTRQRFSAQLGKAMVLQRQGSHDQALATLAEVIDQASPDDTATQAEAFLRQGESLQASGKEKDALLAYLHVDILFPGEAGPHAEALYHLSQLWAAAGRAERAAEARRKLEEKYPATEWAKKL